MTDLGMPHYQRHRLDLVRIRQLENWREREGSLDAIDTLELGMVQRRIKWLERQMVSAQEHARTSVTCEAST